MFSRTPGKGVQRKGTARHEPQPKSKIDVCQRMKSANGYSGDKSFALQTLRAVRGCPAVAKRLARE
jgi:hypothetical protein